jgi:hypothetical protein
MPEKSFYKVHTSLELKPGYEIMPVFYSPDGEVVSREEATQRRAELVRVNTGQLSERDIEKAVDDLLDVLFHTGKYSGYICDFYEVLDAIEEMAADPATQYKVGSKVGLNALERMVANDESAVWSIRMLAKSGDKKAITVLTKFLHYSLPASDHTEHEKRVVREAKEALSKLVGEDADLRYKVAIEARGSIWSDILADWIKDLLKGVDDD